MAFHAVNEPFVLLLDRHLYFSSKSESCCIPTPDSGHRFERWDLCDIRLHLQWLNNYLPVKCMAIFMGIYIMGSSQKYNFMDRWLESSIPKSHHRKKKQSATQCVKKSEKTEKSRRGPVRTQSLSVWKLNSSELNIFQ